MSDAPRSAGNRRDFLIGRALRSEIERAGGELADAVVGGDSSEPRPEPGSGDTVRLGTRAMACDFAVVMNPNRDRQVAAASDALDLIHRLEDQMSVYRAHSELSQLNARAAFEPVAVEAQLFDLLWEARLLCLETQRGFDPTSGPLIALWRNCRQQGRIPTAAEISECRASTGIESVEFNETARTVFFRQTGVELNLGGIGKGYALDRAGRLMVDEQIDDWLLHGGHSSLLAHGDHNGLGGWPVGIRNPLFPERQLATILLKDCALSSSGSGVQHFRHGGRRYGHILDPRTGWPVEGMLSVTVLAPTAAQADALSTAFFVIGLEGARRYCAEHPEIRALLIPPPTGGPRLEPVNCGIPEDVLFWSAEEIGDM